MASEDCESVKPLNRSSALLALEIAQAHVSDTAAAVQLRVLVALASCPHSLSRSTASTALEKQDMQ